MSVEKLYESDSYLVVNKPYDMYINSDDETEKNTVTYHIALSDSHLSTSARPIHFVQRLDYSTSGVLCLAKNRSSAARAGRLFESRETSKYYLAIVRGHVKKGIADIEYDVAIDEASSHTSHKMVAVTAPCVSALRPRAAYTRLLALESGAYDEEPATVVLLKPITGRRHQLRVHCAAIGHIVVGDYTYSGQRDTAPHRMMLHATRLVLPLPCEPLDVTTKEPFFSDPAFLTKWSSGIEFQSYRRPDEFRAACGILDKSYELGIGYTRYHYEPREDHHEGEKENETEKEKDMEKEKENGKENEKLINKVKQKPSLSKSKCSRPSVKNVKTNMSKK